MSLVTVTLMGPSRPVARAARRREIRYRDVLMEIFGSEEDVAAACMAHDQVAARYLDEALPRGKSDEERAAVSRWWAADRAAERAAFVAWAVHPRGVWFEVGV